MDSPKCQTSDASPAKQGDVELLISIDKQGYVDSFYSRHGQLTRRAEYQPFPQHFRELVPAFLYGIRICSYPLRIQVLYLSNTFFQQFEFSYEWDVPLDEANIGRLANLLDEIAK